MGKLKNIIVVPYDSGWTQQFQHEAAKIKAIFGQELISIHHIGSTSIFGINAKPIIDLMPLVRSIGKIEIFYPALMQFGYEPMGEYGIADRRLFFKGCDTKRTHIMHAFEPDHPEVTRLLDFRDYLIAHPEQARRYGTLKIKLARQFPHDIDGYRIGKAPFIKETIQKARQWCAEHVED